jgi:hypothetical protein
MNFDEQVFWAIAKRWESRADDISFFAKGFWHSFEEWLNWEAALGCRDAEIKNVWPKSPYSHKNQDRPHEKVIRFKDSRCISDLMADSERERVVVEVKVVHGKEGANREKLESDRGKLDPGNSCPTDGRLVLPLLIVVSFYHPENPQNPCLPNWFAEWVKQSESIMGVPMKHEFELAQRGLFEVRGWRMQARPTVAGEGQPAPKK